MFKEVNDMKKACETIILKSKKIQDTGEKIKALVSEIELKTDQEDAVIKALAMRKELANLFILNSNIEDILKTQEKVFNSLKKLTTN